MGARALGPTHQDVLDKLRAERRTCEARVAEIAQRLERERATWVPRGGGGGGAVGKDAGSTRAKELHGVADFFLSSCVLPRLTLSAADAVYCYEFVKRMQALETPGWSAILFYVS